MKEAPLTTRVLDLVVQSIGNEHLRLDYLATAGPRLVGLYLAGSNDNLMAEVADLRIPTSLGDFSLYGGHRLWHSPEASPRSYIPDDEGVEATATETELKLSGLVERGAGIRKHMQVALADDRPALTVHHRLENQGMWPVELAPWALSMMRLGGVAILPQTNHKLDEAGLLPNRNLVLWPYTRLSDPRLHLDDDLVLIKADPRVPPCKVGYMNRHGWMGYLVGGTLFVKRFQPQPERIHVDYGCNSEVYCSDRFIEVESLGPLDRLEPGQSVVHVEHWELHRAPNVEPTIDGIRKLVDDLDLPIG
jgi:hypothetical protein